MITTDTVIVPQDIIQRYADQIVAAFQPEKIILFGSYAYGSPSGDSDVDLLVLMPRADDAITAAVAIRQRVPASFPVDLLVRSFLLVTNDPVWNTLRPAAQYLSALGISVRYPGFSATKHIAQQALTHAAAIRAAVRTSLGM